MGAVCAFRSWELPSFSKIPPKGNELANRKKQGLRVDGEVFPDLIHSFQLAAGGLWFQYFTLYNGEICAIHPQPFLQRKGALSPIHKLWRFPAEFWSFR